MLQQDSKMFGENHLACTWLRVVLEDGRAYHFNIIHIDGLAVYYSYHTRKLPKGNLLEWSIGMVAFDALAVVKSSVSCLCLEYGD